MAIVSLVARGAKACDFFQSEAYPDKIGDGHSAAVFEDTTTPFGNWTQSMNRGYIPLGNPAILRIYWASITAAVGSARWRAEVERLAQDGNPLTGTNFGTAKEVTDAASAVLGAPRYAEITLTNADMGGLLAGELHRLRITRDTGDVEDSLLGPGYILGWEISQDQ